MWARIDFLRESIDWHCQFDRAVAAALPPDAVAPAKGSHGSVREMNRAGFSVTG